MTLAVVGGSGLYQLDDLQQLEAHAVETPFGAPSDRILEGRLDGQRILFLARHGQGHRLTPSEVPYAANIWALKSLGATHVLSVSAVGGLRDETAPGVLLLPDQFIDRTIHRQHSFFGDGVVGHVSMADPVCANLRRLARDVARDVGGGDVIDGGVYLCMEGPQFSTRAESRLYRHWGCDVIGMTNSTEARLAREAGLCYASACFVTDWDSWKTDEAPVSVEAILAVLADNVERGRRIVATVLRRFDELSACACGEAARHAVVTQPEAMPAATRARLELVLAPRGGA